MPSGTVKGEEAFKSVPDQESLCPVSEVHSAFSNGSLPFTSEGMEQPKAIAKVCYVWGFSWTTLTKNPKEGFSYLVLGFVLAGLCLIEGALKTRWEIFI